MKKRALWLIPMMLGILLFLIYGGIGVFMVLISRSPIMTVQFDPFYPLALAFGPTLSYLSFKQFRNHKEGT